MKSTPVAQFVENLKRWTSIRKARGLVQRRRGSLAIRIGLMLRVLIGMVSLGTEIPYVLHNRRQLQTAAATRIDPKNVAALNEARAVTASARLVHGAAGVTVFLTRPQCREPMRAT